MFKKIGQFLKDHPEAKRLLWWRAEMIIMSLAIFFINNTRKSGTIEQSVNATFLAAFAMYVVAFAGVFEEKSAARQATFITGFTTSFVFLASTEFTTFLASLVFVTFGVVAVRNSLKYAEKNNISKRYILISDAMQFGCIVAPMLYTIWK